MVCLNNWTKQLNEGAQVDAVYFDFKKAFDSVPHERLLYKLSLYGIKGRLHSWIRQFLTGRRQCVSIKSSFSEDAAVRSGVPQGSVLGPLLFLIFVDDLPREVDNHIVMFADDVKIWSSIRSLDDSRHLQNNVDKIQKWAERWLLQFNTSKCVSLSFKTRRSEIPTSYRLNDYTLNRVSSQKDLGVTMQTSLKPTMQCARAANKAMSVMRRIKRSFTIITPDLFGKIYASYVRPHLEYAVQAWHPYLKKDENMLFNVQRRCTKLVEGFHNFVYTERESMLNLFPFHYRLLRGDLILAFRIIRMQDCALEQEDFFTFATTTNLRGHPWKLKKERSRCLLRQKFFSERVLDPWNALPEHVVSAPNLDIFKSRLDNYLFFPLSQT
jgi:hypothetical protein